MFGRWCPWCRQCGKCRQPVGFSAALVCVVTGLGQASGGQLLPQVWGLAPSLQCGAVLGCAWRRLVLSGKVAACCWASLGCVTPTCLQPQQGGGEHFGAMCFWWLSVEARTCDRCSLDRVQAVASCTWCIVTHWRFMMFTVSSDHLLFSPMAAQLCEKSCAVAISSSFTQHTRALHCIHLSRTFCTHYLRNTANANMPGRGTLHRCCMHDPACPQNHPPYASAQFPQPGGLSRWTCRRRICCALLPATCC